MGFPSAHLPLLTGTKPAKAARTGHEGKGLEHLLSGYQVGVTLTQFGQAARRIKRKGQNKTEVIAVAGPCDFAGTLVDGRSVWLDAKESAEPASLKTDDTHLSPAQRGLLVGHGTTGALAGLLCLRRTDRTLWWCDWSRLVVHRDSVPWGEMRRIGPASRAIDWSALAAAFPPPKGGTQC